MTRAEEHIVARGHPRISGKHPRSFEITKDKYLTARGDCIIGVAASKGARDLTPEFQILARNASTIMRVELEAQGYSECATGRGSPDLSFTHETDLVARKSTYVSNRTLMICSSKAASEFDKELLMALRDPRTRLEIRLVVEL